MDVKLLMGLSFMVGHVGTGIVIHFFPELLQDAAPPKLVDEWWGNGPLLTDATKFPKDDPAIKKFVINVEESILDDLKRRLNNTRFVEPLQNVQFHYGFNPSYLKEVVEYWKSEYDWRKHEKTMNKFDHFITQIEGISIHFIHEKPKPQETKLRVLPLLLVHGGPGSFYEFYKVLPILTTPREGKDYVFEVICPSIPGFGFSEAPHQAGFDVAAAARLLSKLMDRLGHKEFYAQGGDWGSLITTAMSIAYPERVLGLHLNFLSPKLGFTSYLKYAVGALFPSLIMTPEEQSRIYPLKDLVYFILKESGYLHIQGTKPDTVGSVLTDTPAGLAAYILEKFSVGTNTSYLDLPDGGLTEKISLDELLTNVMIYWCTDSITSSLRFYKEAFRKVRSYDFDSFPIKVPSGIAAFPNDRTLPPKFLIEKKFRSLVSYSRMPRGGHFAALEEPELLGDDIWEFVIRVENFKNLKH